MTYNSYQLQEVCSFIDYRGKTPPKTTEGIPLITAKIIKNGAILAPQEFIAADYYDEWMRRGIPKKGSIVFTTEAPLGEVAQIKTAERIAFAQRVIIMEPNPDILDANYLLYALQDQLLKERIKARATGTTVIGIKAAELKKVIIDLPPLDVQKNISDILRSFDNKIELNQKINQNLEQQGQAIYTAIFQNNFEEMSTTPRTLGDIANITMGQSPNGSSYNEEGIGEVFYQGRAEFGFRFPTRRLYTTEPKRFAEAGDILLSVRAPVGDLNVAYERCCIGRGLGAIHSKTDNRSFILYTMCALKPQLDIFNGEGTVFGSINRDALNSIPLNVPAPEAISRFESVVQPIDELIRVNYEEICYLQALRDTLLPKLMSGEIDVSNIQL